METALNAACNWMAERPWTVAVLLAAAILFVGAVETPAAPAMAAILYVGC